jgi:hypothetical protein
VFRAGNPHRYIVDRIADHYTDSVEHTWLVSHGGYRLFRMPVTSFSSWRFHWTNRPVTVAMRIVKKPFQTPEIVRMHRPFAAVAVLSTAAALLALAGCGSSTSPTGSQVTSFKSLPAADQAAISTSVASEVAASVASFSSFDPYSAGFFNRVVNHRAAVRSALHASIAHTRGPRFQSSSSCTPTESPANPVDEDGDGVADADTLTLACSIALNPGSDSINYDIAISDPTPQVADLDYNASLSLFSSETGGSAGNDQFTFVGSGNATETPGLITQQGSWTLTGTVANAPDNTNGTLKFVESDTATYAYTGAFLTTFGENFPAGTFNLSGNWTWNITSSSLNGSLSFTLSTPGGLNIQPGCGSTSSIESGTLVIAFTDGTKVTATWANCQETPSYTTT